jgi:hypothetical protein
MGKNGQDRRIVPRIQALAANWYAGVYFPDIKSVTFWSLPPLMEKELTDRAAGIHDRLTQLRDSL